jgi:hypothetical protein
MYEWRWLGVFVGPNTISSRWTESGIFWSTGAPDRALFIVRCLPRQPTVGACSSRPFDLTITQTVLCALDSPLLQPEGACLRAPMR